MRAWLRSAWTALLDRAPRRLPALAASIAIITAVTAPGALRDAAVAMTVIALLGKRGDFARAPLLFQATRPWLADLAAA